jgi:hypothetical protein
MGSRFLGKKAVNLPFLRRVILKGGILFTRIISHIPLTDTHNGFRAITTEALGRMRLFQDRMEHASEIIDQIYRQRLKWAEVPVTIRYTDYSKAKGQSNTAMLKIASRMIIHKIVD